MTRVALVTGWRARDRPRGRRGAGAGRLHGRGRRPAGGRAGRRGRRWRCALDVTDSGSVERAVDEVTNALGPIDVLVNNAGWDEFRPFLETDEEFWDRVIDVNFKGCLRHDARGACPGMVERGHGRVVNIGVGRGPGGFVAGGGLLGREGRRDRVHEDARARGRAPRGDGERGLPGPDRDADAGGDDRRRRAGREGDRGDEARGADEAARHAARRWPPRSRSCAPRRRASSPARR